ncbi:UNVERIFIED_CONTAM: DDT domain-containing protein PTM [Sesamum latifolium]|uniref:DDT domain-containing protein PTM n=1 Tax=Sesamum latifolium TaxID=2727402 RepID=A0AAW2Y2W5_9LAMI
MAVSNLTNFVPGPVLSGNSLSTMINQITIQMDSCFILVEPTSSGGLIGRPAELSKVLQVKRLFSQSTRNSNDNFSAANLAILSSEENQVPEPRSSCNRRNAMSDNVSLQVKAFSSAAMRFFWPNTEKFQGNLLSNGDGRLPGIITYIMFMEESLRGLLTGPFLNDTFRKRWRKQVEQATTCNVIKILLLEQMLLDQLRSVDQGGVAGNPKSDDSQDLLTDFTWWRGGKLSKLMFQRGILPCSMIRKAARQGGSKKMPGIHYVEGHEIPKCSRQLIWRSAVEMSRNLAQLALQVRYLDFHVRWTDLVRPEQTPADGKGPDTEASAFRNAFISDKKTVEHEIRYCIAFGSQKHLPSRVMKTIAEVEQILDDGKERYWFPETRIPLYLIKEYEEKVEKNKSVDVLSKLQRRQWKPYRKNIFSYLSRKQDNLVKSYCSSCHQDVLHRNAVKCSACQGFCHEQCATSSTVHMNEEIEFLITCKHCCETRAVTQVQSSYGSPTSPLLLQGRDFPNAGSTNKRGLVGHKGPSASVGALEYSSEMKLTNGSTAAKKSKNKNWGLYGGRRIVKTLALISD